MRDHINKEIAHLCRAFADLAITIEYRDRNSVLYKSAVASADAYAARVIELLRLLGVGMALDVSEPAG